ncbi:MAG TPA: flagellar biosynthetic protein FliO [Pseudohongiella sp.]|nr:flagellar biosynthetic protein FliO [Pseudohongiella sp.]|tara:strand:+ start:30045 stop:30437 length:393 start_codon:yes stop_codon:yes gene_type:complete
MAESMTQAAEQAATQTAMLGAGGASAVAQTVLWLMVIIGLILALAWVARRFSGATGFGGQGMKVISALPVGNRERVALVQVGDKQLLLGVAPGNVNLLHVFDEPVLSQTPGTPNTSGFQTILKNALHKKP